MTPPPLTTKRFPKPNIFSMNATVQCTRGHGEIKITDSAETKMHEQQQRNKKKIF